MSNVEITSLYTPDPSTQENYVVSIHGHNVITTVTSRPSVVRKWIYNMRHYHHYRLLSGKFIVGLGVQWNPNCYTITPDTLQLCVGHQCLIFQLCQSSYSPDILHRFLSEDDVTFVGIWNNRDAELLRGSEHGLNIGRLVDARHVACDWMGIERNASMGTLAARVLGFGGLEKDEWVGRSAWDDEWLSAQQVAYACVDAFVSFMVGKSLQVWKWADL